MKADTYQDQVNAQQRQRLDSTTFHQQSSEFTQQRRLTRSQWSVAGIKTPLWRLDLIHIWFENVNICISLYPGLLFCGNGKLWVVDGGKDWCVLPSPSLPLNPHHSPFVPNTQHCSLPPTHNTVHCYQHTTLFTATNTQHTTHNTVHCSLFTATNTVHNHLHLPPFTAHHAHTAMAQNTTQNAQCMYYLKYLCTLKHGFTVVCKAQ